MGQLSRGRIRRPAFGLCVLALATGCASPHGRVVHELKAGETVYRLSRYYDVPAATIVRANRIRDVSRVPVGARLVIPGAHKSPPRRSIALAGVVPPVSAIPRATRQLDLRFGWPVRGSLTSRFGWRRGRPHEGIDIGAKSGAPVYAAEAGRVIHSGWLGGYGRVVIVKHTGRYSTVYAHNRKNRVKKGAFVEKGQLLAEIGATGNASGPHLHFEIRRDRKPQDPMAYLR